MGAPNSFGGYAEQNVYPQQAFYGNGNKPQIYTVSVQELCEGRIVLC